jgi:hypothetical protein
MRATLIRILPIALIIALCALLSANDVAAQCALCRSSVPQALAKNFNIAVIVLLAPPVTIFSVIFYVAFKNRKG